MSSIVVRTHLRNLEGGMRRGFWDSIMSCFLFWVLLLCTHVYFVDLGTSLSILYFFSFFFFFKFVYLLFMAVLGLHLRARASRQLRQVGATPHRGARTSHYRGLSCCGAQAPDAQAQ